MPWERIHGICGGGRGRAKQAALKMKVQIKKKCSKRTLEVCTQAGEMEKTGNSLYVYFHSSQILFFFSLFFFLNRVSITLYIAFSSQRKLAWGWQSHYLCRRQRRAGSNPQPCLPWLPAAPQSLHPCLGVSMLCGSNLGSFQILFLVEF